MKQSVILNGLKVLTLSMLLGTNTSCSSDALSNDETIHLEETPLDVPLQSLSAVQRTCTVRKINLGPGASANQSCSDKSNPKNVGTLDCRATGDGGYSESGKFGVYTIIGGMTNDASFSVRAERSFQQISNGKNKSAQFNASLRITALSKKGTSIAQVHATGDVFVNGRATRTTAKGPIWLLVAERDPNDANKYILYRSDVTKLGGRPSNGGRAKVKLRSIDKGREYPFSIVTGYDNTDATAFTEIKIASTTFKHQHAYTTGKMALRYGAYVAATTGSISDKTAVIQFKNTTYCHPK